MKKVKKHLRIFAGNSRLRVLRGLMAAAFVCQFLLLILAVPICADEKQLLYDEEGILTDTEAQEIETQLQKIRESYHFDACILIQDSYYEYEDDRDTAAEFMQQYDIGYGDSHEGMILYHQPENRMVTVVFRGESQYDFDTSVQDFILDDCTEYLKKDDTAGAYQAVLSDLKTCLSRVSDGKSIRPMDVSGTPFYLTLLQYLLIGILGGAVPAGLATLWQVHRMKTNRPMDDADAYMDKRGLHLTAARDMFLYRNVTRTPRPKNENHGGGPGGHGPGGGMGGGFSHGGEHFSGSSRKY